MAVYNEILAGRFNRYLQKFLSMKGGPPSPQLGSEIVPSLSLFNGAENRYLESWNRFAISTQIVGSGGARGGVRLRNPAGSNVVIVVESVFAYNGGASVDFIQFYVQAIGADLATTRTAGRIDARGSQNSTGIYSFQNTPTPTEPAISGFTLSAPLNTLIQLMSNENQELTILPGDGLDVLEGTTAIQWNVSMMWRERFLEDSERT